MTINKLVAGPKGAAGNSTGADVAAAVNGLIDVAGGSVTSVLEHGAIGDGVTDDTVAIQAALNSDARTVVFPVTSKYYLSKMLTIPTGKRLVGVGRIRKYTVTGYSDFEGTVAIVLKTEAGSNSLLSLQGAGCYFEGLNFVGNLDRSKSLFSGTSVEATANFMYCGAYYFSFGFGKAGGYVRNSRFFNCHSHANNVGFYNLIDSHVYMCEINANQLDGVRMHTGSGDTAFVGNKVEWNGRFNYQFYQSGNSTINGGVCDRSGDHGIQVTQSVLSINGVMLRRNGRVGGKAHINHENNTSLLVVGCNSVIGADDDGSGTFSPDYFATGTGAPSGYNLIANCNVTGNMIGVSSGVQSQIFYRDCKGNPNTPMPYILTAATIGTGVANRTTVTGTFLQSIASSSPATNKVKLAILFRNTVSGLVASQEFIVQLARSGFGSGAATIIYKQTPSSTTINDTGANLNITFENVAVDCTSFDVVCTNAMDNNMQLRVQVFQAEQV
jgi:hypothetical protein